MNSADLADDEPTAASIHDWTVPQQPQNVQPGPTPSPKDKPANCPNITNLNQEDYNRCLQETLAYFNGKTVRIPDGRKGIVVGCDPRPMKGVPTSAGRDGNYLVVNVQVSRKSRSYEHVWFMPDDLTVIETLNGKEIKT